MAIPTMATSGSGSHPVATCCWAARAMTAVTLDSATGTATVDMINNVSVTFENIDVIAFEAAYGGVII